VLVTERAAMVSARAVKKVSALQWRCSPRCRYGTIARRLSEPTLGVIGSCEVTVAAEKSVAPTTLKATRVPCTSSGAVQNLSVLTRARSNGVLFALLQGYLTGISQAD